MKKSLLFVVITLFSFVLKAQIQDLTKMAQGDLVYSDIIFDNENNLWGYFYLYKIDAGKEKDKMEYVVLDKNLNKMNNGTYESPKSMAFTTYRTYNNCMLMGNQLVLDISLMSEGMMIYNSMRILNLDNSQESEEFLYDGKEFKPVPVNSSKYAFSKTSYDSLYNRIVINPVYEGNKKGYLISQFNVMFKREREKKIDFFDENKQWMWTYTYNLNTSNKSKDPYTTFRYINLNGNRLIASEADFVKKKVRSQKIIAINFDSGVKEFEYQIQNDTSTYHHYYETRVYGDTLYLVGKYFRNVETSFSNPFLGYFRIVIDSKGKEISKVYKPWSEISTIDFPLKENGKVKKGPFPFKRTYEIYKDGSVSVITEGVHEQHELLFWLRFFTLGILNIADSYAEDFLVYQFDKDFNFKGVDVIPKSKTKETDNFLFSTYVKGGVESMALMTDYAIKNGVISVKEKDLLISKINSDTITTDRIPLYSPQKFSIYPMPAKDGYILLREYNEKAKYNQIRLEKLNE